jgi:hypothetical protein
MCHCVPSTTLIHVGRVPLSSGTRLFAASPRAASSATVGFPLQSFTQHPFLKHQFVKIEYTAKSKAQKKSNFSLAKSNFPTVQLDSTMLIN